MKPKNKTYESLRPEERLATTSMAIDLAAPCQPKGLKVAVKKTARLCGNG